MKKKEEIGIQALRGGTIFGEHEIMFAGLDEIIEIKHTALSKDVFVQGALAAAKALQDKDWFIYIKNTLLGRKEMVLQTEFAQIKGNDLYIDDVKATDLVKQYGSPLYVMSEGHIRKQFNTLKTKMIDKYKDTITIICFKIVFV